MPEIPSYLSDLDQMRQETAAHLHVHSVFDDPEFKQALEDTTHPLHPAVLAKHKEAFPHLYTQQISDNPLFEPAESTEPVSFWDEPGPVSEPIHKAIAPTNDLSNDLFFNETSAQEGIEQLKKIPLPTPQNNLNQYPSIGQPAIAPSTSEFLPTIVHLAQIQTPKCLPTTLFNLNYQETIDICGYIRGNKHQLPSNPNWNAQLDTQFEVCAESIAFIENVVGQFPSYLRLPHIEYDGYSKREEVCTAEYIARRLQSGTFTNSSGHYEKCKTVWDAVTSAYQSALSYKKHDDLYTKESINLMIIENDKIARKLERALPKEAKIAPVKVTVDRTAYEAKKTEWREAVAAKKKVMLDWDIKIRNLSDEMRVEKIKAGITR